MRRMLAAAVGFTLLLAACGVPADDSPRAIPAGNVPFDLLAPSTTTPPTTQPVQTLQASVFLVSGDRLTQVSRTVAPPISVGGVLASLIQGATDEETTAGLRTAIGPQVTVAGVQVTESTAMVNLSDTLTGTSAQEQILAIAQLVFTATSVPGVANVQFSINNNATEVPRGDGTLTLNPLSRNDFTAQAPPS